MRALPFLAWLAIVALSANASAEPILIHNPDLQGEDFSTRSLVKVYAMQKRVWSDGTAVRVFVMPDDSETHRQFVADYLRMQPYQLNRLWHRLVFSGTGTRPREVNSVKEMIEQVRNTPGAIGYIDSADAGAVDAAMKTGSDHE
ncbi:hypothetical protein E4634_05340 [Mangrovimicrobium sediminis]|uniref:PBP domain-containing protein n=1 Tax=Mangrovimicrobium sediminis TaxID=2562682 RepID=A0A4Z0M5B0_9GAMM|nr:hypothetical protein [Haliea sp. SAOS-164]TGD74626.1 hypothetical protein E4634_05340 [Haliea sp. SAOS-164]